MITANYFLATYQGRAHGYDGWQWAAPPNTRQIPAPSILPPATVNVDPALGFWVAAPFVPLPHERPPLPVRQNYGIIWFLLYSAK